MTDPTDALASLTAERGILFGADYNPEQWPREVWDEDVALMRAAGVSLVTVGPFSWARLEPRPGEYDTEWLDDLLGRLHDADVMVDLATPTASAPPWLGVRWPETRAVRADGVRLSHGSRNHFCPSSPVYRERALAIARVLVDRYADHPAVRMWHVGNEFGQVCFCDLCAEEFRAWLRRRHGTLDALNEAWGTVFWSQLYGDWDEVIPPRAAPYLVNPGQALDFRRFASDQLLELYREQRDVIRAAAPGVPVTTNFMGFHGPTDYWRWSPEVDVVADDVYGDPADPASPVFQAMTHDLARGLGGGRPWVLMEQAAGAVNWRAHNVPKTPARMHVDSLRAVARGADAVCFFQWRQSVFGAERFHSALVPHAGPDTRLHRAVRDLGAGLARLRPVVGTRVAAQVALVFDWPSWWAAEEPAGPSERLRVLKQVQAYYGALHRAGVTVDVVPPTAALARYDLVVVPQLYLVEADGVAALRSVVERGATLLLGPFSGIADGRGHVRRGRSPVPFADLVGASGEEFVPLADDVDVLSETLGDFRATVWGERLRLEEGGTAVATFAGADLEGCPAVVRRTHASGGAGWYVATVPPAETLDHVVLACLRDAGVEPVLGTAPPDGVEAVRRGDVLFLLSTSGEEHEVPVPAVDGGYQDLWSGTALPPGTTAVRLAPHGAMALTERKR